MINISAISFSLENQLEDRKPTWIEKAKSTQKYHREQLQSHDKWTIRDTAKVLRRSPGSIAEDLLIARWLKTHSTQLEKFSYAYEALEWIRKKMREQELENVE